MKTRGWLSGLRRRLGLIRRARARRQRAADGFRDAAEPFRTTNANGRYRFRNLFPGTYVVRQEVPTGFEQLTPADVAGQTLIRVGGTRRRLNFGDAPPDMLGAYMQLGHDHFAYENPTYRTLVARAIRWTAWREVGSVAR